MFWKRVSGRSNQEQEQLQESRQANLQFVDDTWDRLLNAMERLEQRTEKFSKVSASRMDQHRDRDNISEDELEIRAEVHLQIKCLQRVVRPVQEESRWLLEDFLTWYGGRKGRPLAPVDEYAVPTLQCILGQEYHLPRLDYRLVVTEKEILRATQQLGVGLQQTDGIVESFATDTKKRALRHRHHRGGLDDGLHRLDQLQHQWATFFVKRVKEGTLFNVERSTKLNKADSSISSVRSSTIPSETMQHRQDRPEATADPLESQLALLADNRTNPGVRQQAKENLIHSSTTVTVESLETILLNDPNIYIQNIAREILHSLTQTSRDAKIREAAKTALSKADR